MLTRRSLLGACGVFPGTTLPSAIRATSRAQSIEIHMKNHPAGAVVGFDPVGVFLQAGQTVRWICDANVNTTAAYNDNHSLRIPEAAEPWASDFLMPGHTFEVTSTVEGVYDYFCHPHEMAGMVGRLIVGRATGPGSLRFDYFAALGRHWQPAPAAAQRTFPAIAAIVEQKIVGSPLKFST